MKDLLVNKKWWIVTAFFLSVIFFLLFGMSRHTVDFNAQVKPILNKKCITCHGGVRRKAGFSLLFRTDALAKNESGKPAIIPGDPDHSEMIRRLTLRDPEERMPYKQEPLTKDEIEILRRWIKEGAPWGDHWAYVAVQPVDLPSRPDWAKNDIDNFIDQKLKEEKLQHSPEADKPTLLRRVSLDLIGMPAPQNLARKFLNDNSAHAYEDLVDSLLASKHYGERWASMWLDLARYADTKGYERDDSRSIWRYRDWLIHSFNADEPYNQFLTEQIAGDLLPSPTDAQYIATAFQRNTMTNDEGGTDNEEFRTAAVIDRVNTTWEAILGTTFACVQCHSHPYDPFTHEEYYKFMAFFNDTRDEDSYADYPLLRSYNDSMEHELNKVVAWMNENGSAQSAKQAYQFLKTWQPAYNSLNCDSFTNSELSDTKWASFRNHAACRLKNVDLTGRDRLIYRYQGYKNDGEWQIHADKPSGKLIATIKLDTTKGGDWKIAEADIKPMDGIHNLYFTYANNNLRKPIDPGAMLDWLYFTEKFPGQGKKSYAATKKAYWELLSANVPTTPVMMDNPSYMHRPTHVFERGNWLVKGPVVQPDVPHSLNPLPKDAPHNRLGLAMWVVDKKNPLTARTIVNRLWEQLFGTGIVETLEDLGTQGAAPTHKELLDYLAYRLMNDDQWSIKKILKEMVMSATYRQDSKATQEMLAKDPFDKFYERAPRVRLSAEQIRDQALSISCLLNEKMLGPSVFPYQPKGIWLSPWNGAAWAMNKDGNQYRRGLYTYWKRTAAYPAMLTFDATSRELCTVRRINTNTPLQALVTLNDSSYLDMARQFAYRMQNEGGGDVSKAISKGYEMAMYKPIAPGKLGALKKLYDDAYSKMKTDKNKTNELIGELNEHDDPETAALVVVANAMLNLDELITKN
ncbi:MAG: DUF1553 domain-containing protein [Bacteroidetes bacterium]|nr:DUF1553 domain-containing protein [Bacteroidota bacterium]MBS1972899.1 DUF1553 domain-containing protein [Bacteroidota bacterium]